VTTEIRPPKNKTILAFEIEMQTAKSVHQAHAHARGGIWFEIFTTNTFVLFPAFFRIRGSQHNQTNFVQQIMHVNTNNALQLFEQTVIKTTINNRIEISNIVKDETLLKNALFLLSFYPPPITVNYNSSPSKFTPPTPRNKNYKAKTSETPLNDPTSHQ